MWIVIVCGPPCSGKTTLALALAGEQDVVLDYDTIARDLGSPVQWIHPEPYRTRAEHEMQARIAEAHRAPVNGTAWVIRAAPRAQQREALAKRWNAHVYLLNPGRKECEARAEGRPSGTRRSIGVWYSRYTPWTGDLDPAELDPTIITVHSARGELSLDPRGI